MQLPYSEELNVRYLRRLFDKTNNIEDIRYRVYRQEFDFTEFIEELELVILTVYQSLKNCGFGSIRREREKITRAYEW
jgi:hypothetical protein